MQVLAFESDLLILTKEETEAPKSDHPKVTQRTKKQSDFDPRSLDLKSRDFLNKYSLE